MIKQKRKKTIGQGFRTVCLILILLTGIPLISFAEDTNEESPKGGEVVILLDTSASMNKQDKDRLAIDAVKQLSASLPSNYQVGLVTYNTGIQAVVPLAAGDQQIQTQIQQIPYTGYTNAGEGLNQAMGLFSDGEDINRYIVMLTDGEIDMPDSQAREASRLLYEQSADWAKDRGVRIYITAIGTELNRPNLHIFDAAEVTNGNIYWQGASGSLSQIMERIITDRMAFPGQFVDVSYSGTGLKVKLPVGASRVKVLFTGDQKAPVAAADFEAENGSLIDGSQFALIDLTYPSSEILEVRFQNPDTQGIRAYQIVEYTAIPQVSVAYRIEELPRGEAEVKKNVPPVYDHFADIAIQMDDRNGKHSNLWNRDAFEEKEIPYTINGVPFKGNLKSGVLTATIEADEIDQVEVTVDTGGLGGVYDVEQPVVCAIPKVADPVFEPEPNYWPLWIVLGLLAAVILALLFWWTRKSRTTVIYMAPPLSSREPSKKMETKTCAYTGKFNLYVVRTSDGRDIPPQTYRLFGRSGGRLSLSQILTSCGIRFAKIGAEDIVFYPGPDNSIIVMDQSEGCTVMRGTEILKKGMGYPAYYNEKLTVAFEDEATELEIHYKNLKPSERELD